MMKKLAMVLTLGVMSAALLTGCGGSATTETGGEGAAEEAMDAVKAGFTEVESSLMTGVKYEGDTLTIQFTSGKVYEYEGVSQEIYDGLMAAESKGAFFTDNIKEAFETTEL